LALLAYVGVSIGFFGAPVVSHFGTVEVGLGTDPSSFVWFLQWWPHAIGHGMSPFVTHDLWAPAGFNLTHAASVPGAALLAAPVTLAFGPLVAFNALALLAPPLAAWAAYLLCRHVTGKFWPSVLGGYLFGFSTYMVAQMIGHLNLTLVFPVPLCVYLVLLRSERAISASRFVGLLALVLVTEFLLSTEVFLTTALFGGITLLIALAFVGREARRALGSAAAGILFAYAIVGAVVSPYLISFARASEQVPIYGFWPSYYSIDLLNFLMPTEVTRLGSATSYGVTSRFSGNVIEQGAYLGLPVMVLIVLFAVSWRRTPQVRILLTAFAVVVVASLGPTLHVGGTASVTMPWKLMLRVPLVKYALPARFPMYAWLAASLMAAMWLATAKSVMKWVPAALAITALVPNTTIALWNTPVRVPPFFADDLYRRFLPPAANTLVIPYGENGHSMLWQAETDMAFRMPEGYVSTRSATTTTFGNWPIVDVLYSGRPTLKDAADMARFLVGNDVQDVVVVQGTEGAWRDLFAKIGMRRSQSIGGVDLYPVTLGERRTAG